MRQAVAFAVAVLVSGAGVNAQSPPVVDLGNVIYVRMPNSFAIATFPRE